VDDINAHLTRKRNEYLGEDWQNVRMKIKEEDEQFLGF
jgi:hypothetical protein